MCELHEVDFSNPCSYFLISISLQSLRSAKSPDLFLVHHASCKPALTYQVQSTSASLHREDTALRIMSRGFLALVLLTTITGEPTMQRSVYGLP